MNRPITVYCDFDGTITASDCVDFLLNRLASPEWRDWEELWEQNLISSRECMQRQIPLIQGGWESVQRCLAEIDITPGFKDFRHWCHTQGIPFYIVSEGLDRVIHALLERVGITVDGVFSNHLECEPGKPFTLQCTAPQKPACGLGMCKCHVLESGGQADIDLPPAVFPPQYRVVIGDGASDYCWALQADLLFAKRKLKTYCEQQQIPFVPFQDFTDIQNHLQTVLQQRQKAVAVPA
ncbi:MAG TPA: MtnX-like HAD-IB family phosphatase [Oculatellaceae cyanobacterium]|jgi:2-hydroxy-3-keto-5-methylthiopentenyl-1-phosphate phosphatase